MVAPEPLFTARFRLTGLDCAWCARTIEARLRETKGVMKAGVNYFTNEALVEYDPGMVNSSAIMDEIRSAGYRSFQTVGRVA